MNKKKLLVVVGAGASIDFGMPSVKQAGDIINAKAQDWFPLADRPHTNLYKNIEDRVKRRWKKHVPEYLRRDPQFEDILYAIFGLASAYPAAAYTSALGALISAKKLPDISVPDVLCGSRRTVVDRYQLGHLAAFAVDALLSEFRKLCRTTEQEKTAEFARLLSFVTALLKKFDIAVVTLNYDNILYRALPDIETGFDPGDGRFYEGRIFGRKTWPCMLHLHGSVHFDMPTPSTSDMHEIFWKPDISGEFSSNAFGRNEQFTSEGVEFPTSVIVAGYGKTTQILRRPFRTYYSELDRLMWGCDAVLFAGYGFNDRHVNDAFKRFRDNRRRPVAIIVKRDHLALDGDNDAVAEAVVHTLDTDLNSMGYRLACKQHLRKHSELEVNSDPNKPLGVWYFGMLEACDNPDKVVAVLDVPQLSRDAGSA